MGFDTASLIALLEIIGINIVLSGDNAVVIALACRSLPPRQQRLGLVLGAGMAVALLLMFSLLVTFLLDMPFLRMAGGALLLWIGTKLLAERAGAARDVAAPPELWRAVWRIAIANLVMSLDNVIAMAGAAKGSVVLLALGLAVSVPLVMFGAQLMIVLIHRIPAIVGLGAALIGYVGGEVMASDPAVRPLILDAPWLEYLLPLAGAALVLQAGWALKARRALAS
jgi:YjbE family integral membrane protein